MSGSAKSGFLAGASFAEKENEATIKQLQEENRILKEGLEDAINMWDRLDVYADYQQEINEARKLIEP